MATVSLFATLGQYFDNARIDRFPSSREAASNFAPLGAAGPRDSRQVVANDPIITLRAVGRYRRALRRVPPGTITAALEGIAHRTGRGALTIGEPHSAQSGFPHT